MQAGQLEDTPLLDRKAMFDCILPPVRRRIAQTPNGQRMTLQPEGPPAHIRMLQLLNGAHVAGTVACLAQLGIPDPETRL